MRDASNVLKWTSFGLEALLAIPILGGTIILGLYWLPLAFMFILHLVTLILCLQSKTSNYGSVVGIIASVLGWIPVLGWALHVASAVALLVSLLKKEN
jgi:hypothetical protein